MKTKKTLILSFALFISIILFLFSACDLLKSKERKMQDFAESAAMQIISKSLKFPDSAIWNEVSYMENNEKGQYVVYVDVQAPSAAGIYFRTLYFVIVQDIDLENNTFKYHRIFPYLECSGKEDSYVLSVLKILNDYDSTQEEPDDSQNDDSQEEFPDPPSPDPPSDGQTNQFKVTFINDGSIISQAKYSEGEVIEQPPLLSPEDNYVFEGWYIGEQKIDFPYTITQSVDFVAKWTGKECSFNLTGYEEKYTVKYGETKTLPVPEKEGYVFLGWYYNEEIIADENGEMLNTWTFPSSIEITLSPKYNLIKYDVYYFAEYGGSVNDESQLKFESSIENNYSLPEITAKAKPGYRFIQWSDGNKQATRKDTDITKNISFTAEFIKCYELTFKAQTGGSINGIPLQIVDEGDSSSLVTAVPNEGYQFERWEYVKYNSTFYFWSPAITVSTDDINSDMQFIAVFSKIIHTAVYNTNSGYVGGLLKYDFSANSGDNNINNYRPEGNHYLSFSLSIDNSYTAPAITAVPNKGYRFVQWSDGNTQPTRKDSNVTNNITLTAEFIKCYTYTFIAKTGGSISGNALQIIDEGNSASLVTAIPNEGYRFERWEYVEYGSTRYFWSPYISISTDDISSDMQFVAIFSKI